MPAINNQLSLVFIIKGVHHSLLQNFYEFSNTPQETLYNNNNNNIYITIHIIHVIITNKYSNNSGFTNILIQKVNLYIQITVNEHCM